MKNMDSMEILVLAHAYVRAKQLPICCYAGDCKFPARILGWGLVGTGSSAPTYSCDLHADKILSLKDEKIDLSDWGNTRTGALLRINGATTMQRSNDE